MRSCAHLCARGVLRATQELSAPPRATVASRQGTRRRQVHGCARPPQRRLAAACCTCMQCGPGLHVLASAFHSKAPTDSLTLLLLSCSQPAVLLAFYLSYVPCSVYRLDSKTLATLLLWYILFLPGCFGTEIECMIHVALPKWLKLVQQSR